MEPPPEQRVGGSAARILRRNFHHHNRMHVIRKSLDARREARGIGDDISVFVPADLPAITGSSNHLQGFFHQIESEGLIRLCPCQGGMSIRNIFPLFEKVKFRAQAFGGNLGERAIEIMNLFAKARGVRWIRKKALAIDYREDRIKDTPLRLAIRLQKGVAIIEALTEVAAHLRRGKPLVVVLT